MTLFTSKAPATKPFDGTFGGFPAYTYSIALPDWVVNAGTQYWYSVYPDLAFPPQWGLSSGTGGDGISYQDFFGATQPDRNRPMAIGIDGHQLGGVSGARNLGHDGHGRTRLGWRHPSQVVLNFTQPTKETELPQGSSVFSSAQSSVPPAPASAEYPIACSLKPAQKCTISDRKSPHFTRRNRTTIVLHYHSAQYAVKNR